MHTDQIIYLSAIHRSHSLRKASESLHISPQALNQSLNALERELRIKLVDRSRKGTFLTDKGLALLDEGQHFIDFVDSLKGNPFNERYQYLPTLKATILTTYGVGNSLVANALTELALQFPQSEIDVQMMSCQDVVDSVSLKGCGNNLPMISAYFYNGQMIPDISTKPGLSFYPIISSRYHCSVPNDLSISHYDSISMATILKHPLLLYKPTEDIVLPLLKLFGKPAAVRSVASFQIYQNMLKNDRESLSFAQVFKSYETMTPQENRRIVPIKDNITAEVGFLYGKNQPLCYDLQELASYITDSLTRRYQ